jgi:hypothetical protein
MLGFVVSGQIWDALHERCESHRDEHVQALGALPGSFDAAFTRPNRAARRAQARGRRRGHAR